MTSIFLLLIDLLFELQVDRANPPFPRDAAKWWLKCRAGGLREEDLETNEISNFSDECYGCNSEINESNDPSSKGFFKTVGSTFNRIGSYFNSFTNLFRD